MRQLQSLVLVSGLLAGAVGCSSDSGVSTGKVGGAGGALPGTAAAGTKASAAGSGSGATPAGVAGTANGAGASAAAGAPAVAGRSAAAGASAVAGGSALGDAEPANMSGMTAAHNQARAGVSPAPATPIPPLGWSSTIAAAASAYAAQCKFQHSGGDYGENIYATSGSTTAPAVVASWMEEVANYTYATNSCSGGACGHYTQVVWAKSLRLGCGVANCTQNSPFGGGSGSWQFWVCNYDPPGNYVGEKPY